MIKLFQKNICPRCGKKLGRTDKVCKGCGAQPEFFSDDYENRCGSCAGYIGADDLFCRYCGTKRGEGSFKPYYNEPQCVYGPPPMTRKHSCGNCGFEWTTRAMIDHQQYCPKCGSRCNTVEINDDTEEILL